MQPLDRSKSTSSGIYQHGGDTSERSIFGPYASTGASGKQVIKTYALKQAKNLRSLPDIHKKATSAADNHQLNLASGPSVSEQPTQEYTLTSDNKVQINRPISISSFGHRSVLSALGTGQPKLDLASLKLQHQSLQQAQLKYKQQQLSQQHDQEHTVDYDYDNAYESFYVC